MNLKLDWISNHWSILVFVFAAGGAIAMQEQQIETIEEVIIKQAEISGQMDYGKEALIRLDERVRQAEQTQKSIEDKLDWLIKFQLEQDNDE